MYLVFFFISKSPLAEEGYGKDFFSYQTNESKKLEIIMFSFYITKSLCDFVITGA